jgi:hypothetical protein
MGVTKLTWAKNGTPDTLGSSGDTMTISDLTAKKFNQFMWHIIAVTGNVQNKFTYNNNTGTVYAERYNVNGGSDTSLTSQTVLNVDPTGTQDDKFSINYTCSISSEEKLSINFTVVQNATGAATAPMRMEVAGKFVPSPDADVTRIDVVNASAGDYDTSSNLSALGTD